MRHPGGRHCGTDAGGWLSGWSGPHVTGGWNVGDGGPPREYEGANLRLPAPGSPVEDATVCFDDGVGSCDFHMAIRVANCADHLRFELPPAPYCSGGAGLAYCASAAPVGVLDAEQAPPAPPAPECSPLQLTVRDQCQSNCASCDFSDVNVVLGQCVERGSVAVEALRAQCAATGR
jgi:hypothetical protein